jgi:hypothetical protein
MSELRSVVDRLRAESLAELPDARIEEDFTELQGAIEQLEVERLRRLAELDRRRLFERDGHLSATAWVAARFRVAWGSARGDVRIARGLEEMPLTRAGLEDGTISMSAAKVLVAARHEDPEAFDRSEPQLVEAATIHSMNDLRRIAANGDSRRNERLPFRATRRSARGAGSTPRSRSSGWSASTATWIPRPERPC